MNWDNRFWNPEWPPTKSHEAEATILRRPTQLKSHLTATSSTSPVSEDASGNSSPELSDLPPLRLWMTRHPHSTWSKFSTHRIYEHHETVNSRHLSFGVTCYTAAVIGNAHKVLNTDLTQISTHGVCRLHTQNIACFGVMFYIYYLNAIHSRFICKGSLLLSICCWCSNSVPGPLLNSGMQR